ncbi:MAG TPA: hypothetical protein VFO29_03850 [Candidatus Rubrimentiphilum sp.]|nr:hypothetical protein [Candidatus Rubrimentiphilum sp.]
MFPTSRFIGLGFCFVLLAASPAPSASPTPIATILAAPASFDGQHVTVNGTIQQLSERTSRRGNDYTTFDLCDGSCVHVYSYGHPKLSNGQTLTVSGKFFADKHVGNADFKNEIDVDEGSL